MTERPALGVSGSNVAGQAPFSCALRVGGEVDAAASPPGARGDLASLVDGLCARHGVAPAQLREVRIDLGPGSYTGLRVAVTFVRFLQRFSAVQVLATDSLSLLATAALGRDQGRRLRPLIDARRERFHCAALRVEGGRGLVVLDPPRALPWLDVVASATPGDLFVVPPGLALRVETELRARGAEVLTAGEVGARDLFGPALPMAACAAEELQPRYLMGSYAEE